MPYDRERDVSGELEDTIVRLPRLDTFPFRSILKPEYRTEHILLSQTAANLLFGLNRARQARELAVSHRKFNVGASMMGLKAMPSVMRYMSGVNIKPEEDSVINIHAEQLALKKLLAEGFDMISMVVLVGETQNDQQSGRPMHTLHPCGLCRTKLLESDLVDPELTLVVSALPDFSAIEVANLTDLQRFHEAGDDSGIMKFDFEEPLEILTPHQGSEPVMLVDTPQTMVEERKWSEIVEVPLSERRHKLLGELAAKQAL